MGVKVNYWLSPAGQKADLLVGGDGKSQKTIEVGRDDPAFPRVLARGTVSYNGDVTLQLDAYLRSFDAPQTAEGILDALDELDARKKREEEESLGRRRVESRKILDGRLTRKTQSHFRIDRNGDVTTGTGIVHSYYIAEEPAWDYYSLEEVKNSPEALAWQAKLEASNSAAFEAALAEARAKLPAVLEAEAEAARKEKERARALAEKKESMGGTADDYLCRTEHGAIMNVPCWESHSRGKNWLAVITPSPTSPGGLERTFAAKAKGDAFYLVPALSVGDAVEFGADYYTGSGKKSAERWYGFVVAVAEDAILLRPCATGKAACKAGAEAAVSSGK